MISSSLLSVPRIYLIKNILPNRIKGFTAVCIAGFTQAFIATFNYTMMVIWLGSPENSVCPALSLGEGVYYAWLLLVTYDFIELIFKPLISLLSDRAGWRISIVVSVAFQIMSSLALMWSGFSSLLVSRILQGIASSISPTLIALASSLTEKGERYIGLYMGFRGVGYLAAPTLIAVIGQLDRYNIVLLTLTLAFLQLSPLVADIKLASKKVERFSSEEAHRGIYGLLILTALSSMIMGVRFTLIPIIMLRRGLTSRIIGFVLSLGFLVCLIGQAASGLLLDDECWMPLTFSGFTASMLGLAYMPQTSSLLDLLTVALTVNLGSSLTIVSTNTLLARRLPRLSITSTLGLNGLAQNIGELVGLTIIAMLSEINLNLAILSSIMVTMAGSALSAYYSKVVNHLTALH